MTKYGAFLVLAFLTVFGILYALDLSAEEEPEGPSVILTFSPTATPSPVLRQLQFQFIGGSFDAHFQATVPQREDVPDLQDAETPRPYTPASSNERIFFVGWLAAGGFDDPAFVHRFINCESTWHQVTAGKFLGYAQWLPSTWGHVAQLTGFWDWTDPWMHGFNTAYWWQASDPTQQWPGCWYA